MNSVLPFIWVVLACAAALGHSGSTGAQDPASTQRRAQAGNAKAQYDLASDYYNGTGVIKDPMQGLLWLRRSADHGYVWAEKAIGVMYREGDPKTGIRKNPHEAARWFRKAARQQNDLAKNALTQMLADGLISESEANWRALEPGMQAETGKSMPFSLGEVEKGLLGGVTCNRMAALIHQFGVNFSLSKGVRKRLEEEGADDKLLSVISSSKRSL
jgi:TPR repeat protein